MTNTFCPHPGGLFKPPALPVVMTVLKWDLNHLNSIMNRLYSEIFHANMSFISKQRGPQYEIQQVHVDIEQEGLEIERGRREVKD